MNNNLSRKKKGKKSNKKVRNRVGNGYEDAFNNNKGNTSVQLFRGKITHIVSDRQIVMLSYYDSSYRTRGVLSSVSGFWRYRINTLWDPDPLVFTGSVAGLFEWSKFYNLYRVLEVRVKSTISNVDENNVLNFVMMPSPYDITAFLGSTTSVGELNENPMAITKQCGIAWGGKDKIHLNQTIRLADLYGSKSEYLSSPNTSAAINTDPVTQLFLNYAYQVAPSSLAKQFVVDVVLSYVVELFDRKIVFEPGSYEKTAKSGLVGPRISEAMKSKT